MIDPAVRDEGGLGSSLGTPDATVSCSLSCCRHSLPLVGVHWRHRSLDDDNNNHILFSIFLVFLPFRVVIFSAVRWTIKWKMLIFSVYSNIFMFNRGWLSFAGGIDQILGYWHGVAKKMALFLEIEPSGVIMCLASLVRRISENRI